VYAQPLAVANVSGVSNCSGSCNLLLIATEQDMLYAFKADSPSQTPLWSANLASNAGGVYLDCSTHNPPCLVGLIYPDLGVTGTPVISTSANANPNILYVVSAVVLGLYPWDVQYFLHAINITNGHELTSHPLQISASANGVAPMSACMTGYGTGTIQFDPQHHIQRAGLLLLTIDNVDYIYVAFSPVIGEVQNGWILSYSYTATGGLAPASLFVTTPYGTGGGVWEAGAGLASDGASIYASTGNGTFDVNLSTNPSIDYGDSLVELDPSDLGTVQAYYTPSDWNTRCLDDADLDFGSGGILLFPDSFFANHSHLMVSADKESNFYVVDRDTPGGVGGQLQLTAQPRTPPPNSQQGYWSSPAYWKFGLGGTNFQYNLYYSADVKTSFQPLPLNMYALLTSGSAGPIGSGPTASTQTLFCGNPHAATPSISSSGTGGTTGIVWAIESSNPNNPPSAGHPTCDGSPVGPAVLHAYNAVPQTLTPTTLTQLYTSGTLRSTAVGPAVNFPVPTIFNSRVYMGTMNEVDVFGLCSTQTGGCLN
jgi:hypothetical protein